MLSYYYLLLCVLSYISINHLLSSPSRYEGIVKNILAVPSISTITIAVSSTVRLSLFNMDIKYSIISSSIMFNLII